MIEREWWLSYNSDICDDHLVDIQQLFKLLFHFSHCGILYPSPRDYIESKELFLGAGVGDYLD